MSKYKLSLLEKILLTVTVVVVCLSIMLSLCIGLILPPNFIYQNKINYNLVRYCKCDTIQKPRQLTCMPETLEHISEKVIIFNKPTPHRLYQPYLVSLSINVYRDDNLEKRFACTGVIISYSWIIAGQDCIIEHKEWFELQVRAGSVFWSKGGTLHRVKKILQFYKNGPVCLSVFPRFYFSKYINAAKISNTLLWTIAFSPYWRNTNIYKNNRYHLEKWSKNSCNKQFRKIGELRSNIMCNVTLLGKPLIAGEILIGFQVGVCNVSTKNPVYIFLDFQNSDYLTWLTEIITSGESQYKNTSIRNDELVTYIYEETRKCIINDNINFTTTNKEEKVLSVNKPINTDSYIWYVTNPPDSFH